MSDYFYYRVNGGAVKEALNRFWSERAQRREEQMALCKEFGASGTFGTEFKISALTFKEGTNPPEGWLCEDSAHRAYRPPGKTKAGRALIKRFGGYPMPGCQKLQEYVHGRDDWFLFMEGTRVRWMSAERITTADGVVDVLMIPKLDHETTPTKWTPPDDGAVLLKNSEYWAIKEAALPNK